MDLKRSSQFIGIFILIASVIVVIGSLLTIARGEIDFIIAGIKLEYTPLFSEIEYDVWNYYRGFPEILYYELFLNDLFSKLGSKLLLPSNASLYAIIILIVGLISAFVGIIELIGRIAVALLVLTLIFGIILIVLPIIEFYMFKNEIFETSKTLYLIFLFPWYIDLIFFLLYEIETTVAIGFYLILIPAAILTIISIYALIAQRKRY
jgi:hypothetical protein